MLLVMMISGLASAEIVEDWPFGTRNTVPDGAIMIDFEDGTQNLWKLTDYGHGISFEGLGDSEHWGYIEVGGRAMHLYPYDFYHNPDGTEVDFTYIVNGAFGAAPIEYDDTLGQPWPSAKGIIQFENGTNHVSFLASIGSTLEIKAYGKSGNYLGTSGRAYDNIQRVYPSGPSTFTQLSYTSTKPDIYCIEIIGTFNNWMLDDLVIGGLIDPEPETDPTDYEYVADRAVQLFGVPYLEFALGFDYGDFTYMEVEQFEEGQFMEYWNPDTKNIEMGVGISDEGLVLWAYNYDSKELHDMNLVKWNTAADMLKHDFKEPVDFDDTQPGDVYFVDENQDGKADKVGMVITENTPGMDLITVDPELGVVLMNSDTVETQQEFLGYYRLPETIHGGHNPIKKIGLP